MRVVLGVFILVLLFAAFLVTITGALLAAGLGFWGIAGVWGLLFGSIGLGMLLGWCFA